MCVYIRYKCFPIEMTDCAHFYESKDSCILQSCIFYYLQYQPWTKQTSLQFLLHWSQNDLLIYLARCPNATMLKCCWNRNAAITEIQQRMVEREIRKSFLSLKRRSVKASKPRGSCLVISDGSNFAKLLIILHCYTHIDRFVHVYWMKLLKLDKCVQLEAKGKHVSLHVNHLTHHTLAPFSL